MSHIMQNHPLRSLSNLNGTSPEQRTIINRINMWLHQLLLHYLSGSLESKSCIRGRMNCLLNLKENLGKIILRFLEGILISSKISGKTEKAFYKQ